MTFSVSHRLLVPLRINAPRFRHAPRKLFQPQGKQAHEQPKAYGKAEASEDQPDRHLPRILRVCVPHVKPFSPSARSRRAQEGPKWASIQVLAE